MKIDLDMVTDSKQEVADLEEFVGHLINGMPVEKALDRVWPNRARPTTYCSDVNGSLIGWDVCGGCNRHVSRCSCADGPREPAYFARLRHEDAIRKAKAAGNESEALRLQQEGTTTSTVAPKASAAASSSQGSSTSGPTEEASSPSASSTPAVESPSSRSTMVPCQTGKHLVEESTAERNDDGSWTCFEHQASAALRDGADDD